MNNMSKVIVAMGIYLAMLSLSIILYVYYAEAIKHSCILGGFLGALTGCSPTIAYFIYTFFEGDKK